MLYTCPPGVALTFPLAVPRYVRRATLGPGFGGLWRFADPLAKKLLVRQLVVLGLLRIAPLRRLLPEKLLDPPAVIVPTVSVVALVSSAIFTRQGRPALAKAIMHHLVCWGGIPVINESIAQMLEDVGDAGAQHTCYLLSISPACVLSLRAAPCFRRSSSADLDGARAVAQRAGRRGGNPHHADRR